MTVQIKVAVNNLRTTFKVEFVKKLRRANPQAKQAGSCKTRRVVIRYDRLLRVSSALTIG